MTERRLRCLLRAWHRWLGAALALFVLVAGGTGLVLQHPHWLGAPAVEVTALAADPRDPQRLLRGSGWGVEVSEDGGASWREAPMLQPPSAVQRIAFVPGVSDTVYVLGAATLLRSADGGRVWELLDLPRTSAGGPVRPRDLGVGTDGTLELLAADGHWRRRPGEQWRRVSAAGNAEGRDWRQLVRDLHTGRLFGATGRLAADLTAAGLLVLTITGLVLVTRGRRTRA
jgi:hypothetical protein